MVKGYLSLRGVEFTEKNVATDLKGRAELLDMGFDSTPVIVIGDIQLYGFDVEEIDEALAALDSD
jgi:glutaredoxin